MSKSRYITYETEKLIKKMDKEIKKEQAARGWYAPPLLWSVAVDCWNELFRKEGFFWDMSLKELEAYVGGRLSNYNKQLNIDKDYYESRGIFGIEYKTDGNVRYVGTHDLHYLNIEDFNKFVKQAFEKYKI